MRRRLGIQQNKQTIKKKRESLPTAFLCGLLFLIVLNACDSGNTGTISAGGQSINYNTGTQDVVVRTLYGGGLYGSFATGPQVSIYGDGTYILGLEQQGKLSSDDLQKLLNTVVGTYDLLDMKRLHFSDMPDQNATYLELYLNGKSYEFAYGTFGSQPQSKQDLDEYDRLGKAITALNEGLNGQTQAYNATTYALLARQNFNPDANTSLAPDLAGFTLAQAAKYICGEVPTNENTPNRETGCLKYTRPQNALLLNASQVQTLKNKLGNTREGTFQEGENYYTVVLRPLLPDEQVQKKLAMFGSSQSKYEPVPLQETVK
jgi:hypothetical protein